MARIGILRYREEGTPWLFTSRKKATLYVQSGTHEWISKKVIREVSKDATPQPDMACRLVTETVAQSITVTMAPEKLNPPACSTNLVLYYPVRDMSSVGERNFRSLWSGSIYMPSMEKLREVYGPSGYILDISFQKSASIQ